VLHVSLLIEITLHEALHVGYTTGAGISAEDLQIDRGKVMVGIRIELALEIRQRLWLDRCPSRVRVAERAGDAVDPRVHRSKGPKHVVERSILHHEYNDVLYVVLYSHLTSPSLSDRKTDVCMHGSSSRCLSYETA